ncbi:hypothetical protein CHU98_g7543 [Xylaria longipes]|nr:hypothetical protein CHU98_g7543 [Xylaria longipes]
MAEQPSSNDILTYVTLGDMEGLKECINKGADVHQPIISGKTSLYYAALWGQNEAVRVLLDAGGDVNVKTKTGTTLLHAAVQSKNEATISAVVEYMKTHNISIDPVDDDGETPLCCAARLALPEVVRQLCKAGSNVNGLDPRGRPLVEATYKGGKSTVRVLLDEGADSNLPDGYEQLPIYWAAKAGDLELLELFQKNLITAEPNKISGSSMALSKAIKASREDEILIDVQSTDEEGWTALHLAANVGHSKAIKALVKADSDVNALNRDGLSPLLLAARKGKVASIEALLDNKAVDVNIRDNVYERTALSWAAETGKSRAVELLAEADSDINSLDKSSQTPLVLAAKKGHSDSIKTLLRFGPDMNIKDTIWGQPAVSFAAAGGYAKTTELLAEAGSDINSLDKFGRTPLILAAKGGHSDSIKVLLQFWPNMNIRDVWARSAVSYAAEDFTGKAAEPLIKAGCNIYSQTEDRYPPLEVVARYAEALHHACDNDYSETKDIILTEERYLTATDEHGRTVLSWAAEIGSEQAVKVLLHNGVEPDSSDLNNRTPLSWAAESGNLAVVRQLLSQIETSGLIPMKGRQTVNSKSKDKNWTPLWYAALGGHVNVIKTLLEDGANPLVEDNEGRNLMKYLATIETSPASEGLSINTIGRKNVRKILEPFFSLLAQSFPSSEEVDKLFTAMVLQFPMNPDGELRPTLPTVEQLLTLPIHTAQSKNICLKWLHLPANNDEDDRGRKIANPSNDKTKGNGPSQRRTETSMAPDSRHKGFVLFKVLRAKDILKEKGALKHNQDASRKFAAQIMEIGVSDTEKLLWMYVGEDHPLHIRRTLDQYYYPNSENIEARDEDQTTLRYFNDQRLDSKKFDRVLTMVDQLWMWVLPKCGESPPTIITAFPQRSDREGEQPTALVSNIVGKCRDLSDRTGYEVAEVIVAECSRIYLDPTSNRNHTVQFPDVYEASIGKIMDNDATRFHSFQDTIGKINEVLGLAKPETSESQTNARSSRRSKTAQGKGSKTEKPLNSEEVLRELLDVEKDIEDLRQIKDIRDELTMMDSLFRMQDGVIRAMHQIIQGGEGRNGINNTSHKGPNYLLYPPHMVVEQNIKEVKRLDLLAEKAGAAIEQLLGLKQKQADLVLTKAIYNINDATDKQGKTILTFTVVTIIFLPSSFMASFLALDVAQFPQDGDKLPLNWVVKIILSVPLSLAIFVIAFYLNESQREKHVNCIIKWKSEVTLALTKSAGYVQSTAKSWKRNNSLQTDAEKAINGTSAPQNKIRDNENR